MDVLACFGSHYSIGDSLLTLEEPGKAKKGNPVSVFDLATEAKLSEVTIVDSRIDGALQALKVGTKLDLKVTYGVKLTVCADMADKSPDSRRTESKVIVFAKGDTINEAGMPRGYAELVRLWNAAWGPLGSFTYRLRGDDITYGRLDWKTLTAMWSGELVLALPFFSSFVARNTLTFSQITPTMPVAPWVFREVESGLPFAPLIDAAIDRYVGEDTGRVVPVKSVYYAKPEDMRAYVTFRAQAAGGTFDEPQTDHLHSDAFSFVDWKRLTAASAPSTVAS